MIDPATSANYIGDCRTLLAQLPEGCVQTCVTSPPYWGLRDYGHEGQIGLETTPEAYVAALVDVFRGVRRALRDDGTIWVNLGDSYASSAGGYDDTGSVGATAMPSIGRKTKAAVVSHRGRKPPSGLKAKDLVGIPWMVAFALRADGWYLRSDIIWSKPNPMPESVGDRPTKAHEYVFLLSKSSNYFYDADIIAEASVYPGDNRAERTDTRKATDPKCIDGGSRARTGRPTGEPRNKRSVWTVATTPYDGAHFATFPPKLIEPCILAGSRVGDLVLDPFFGSGTTGMVAEKHGRRWIGFDLGYDELAKQRTAQRTLPMGAP